VDIVQRGVTRGTLTLGTCIASECLSNFKSLPCNGYCQLNSNNYYDSIIYVKLTRRYPILASVEVIVKY
jgi:hypothetical protein